MKRIAVFPGSFDPITIGHVDIIERAIPLFDEIIMAIGVNSSKKHMFSLEERQAHITATFANEPKIKQDTYSGLTIDYCKKIGANYLLRGMRSEHDFEFERSIALMNRAMASNVETVFLVSAPEFSAVSSTIVRDILRHGGNANQFIPKAIQDS